MLTLTLAALLIACGPAEPAPVPPAEPAPAAATPAAPAASPAAPAPAAPALEALTPASNQVRVTSLKKGTVEDTHAMDVDVTTLKLGTPWDPSTLSGALTVRADTWRSPIEVRDGRVKELFLKAAEHPTATLAVSSVEGFGPLAPGAKADGVVKGTLQVRGGSVPVEAKVSVARGEKGLEVTVTEPVAVTASGLGLSEELKAVSAACGVELADAVKVSAAFTIPQP